MSDVTVIRLRRASNGAPVSLGGELGRGGEGAVYPVADAPDLVAKIYFEPPETDKVAKLIAMVRRAPPELLRIAAWPIDLLNDENGASRGFLMQKVGSRADAHELYSPKSRRRAFPNADFRFIVHAAANVARAFAQLHSRGHVIGDVNHGNALIGRDATVMLIDCDSFQVKDGETRFTCDVGVPLFTPPELQGQNFRGLVRSADHDAFGLAILLFHLLYAGRHPFAGVFADGEMSIERAIAESRFAYGTDAAARGMSAPPGTLPLAAFGAPVAALFERAFSSSREIVRPAAVEWVEALHVLESTLVDCAKAREHHHPRDAGCCWCELESRSSIALFGRVALRVVGMFDLAEVDSLWNQIVAIRPPIEFGYKHAHYAKAMAAKAIRMKTGANALLAFGCLWLALLWGRMYGGNSVLGWLSIPIYAAAIFFIVRHFVARPGRSERKQMLEDAEAALSREPFTAALEQLEHARQRLREIHANPRLVETEAAAARDARWREQILDLTPLTDSRAPALTASQHAALLSFGVESAADVLRERAQLHHALSYHMVRELIQWAESRAAELVAETSVPLDAHDLRAMDDALRSETRSLMTDLRGGADLLQVICDDILAARHAAAEESRKLTSLP